MECKSRIITVCLVSLSLFACGGGDDAAEGTPAPAPTTVAEVTPAPTPSTVPSATPSATPVPSVTATPEPSSTGTPVPTVTVTPTPEPTTTSSPVPTASPAPSPEPTPVPTPTATPNGGYLPIFTQRLDSDGEGGEDALDLIYAAFGERSAETPGLYEDDHFAVEHIFESSDSEVGNFFVFTLHRDEDGDRGVYSDRQRNEIKVHDPSDDRLKGFEGKTFLYTWKFKPNPDLELSRNFSHFFQLKPKNGDDQQPMITISGAESSGDNQFQVRYDASSDGSTEYLVREDWSLVAGEWLDISVLATYAEADEGGAYSVTITRIRDGQVIVDISGTEVDMWRGPSFEGEGTPYVRPKWGYYRSLADSDSLRADEEHVYFADFEVSEMGAFQE